MLKLSKSFNVEVLFLGMLEIKFQLVLTYTLHFYIFLTYLGFYQLQFQFVLDLVHQQVLLCTNNYRFY